MKLSSVYVIAVFIILGVAGYLVGSRIANNEDVPLASEGGSHVGHTNEAEVASDTNQHGDHMKVVDERAFIEAMVPHHREAVASARDVLTRGGMTPEVVRLANAIVASQVTEMTMMEGWYQAWYGTPLPDVPYQAMMRDVAMLEGEALDRAFLTDMVVHHEGAIKMAESVLTTPVRDEVRTLALNIIAAQKAEIETINSLLFSTEDLRAE